MPWAKKEETAPPTLAESLNLMTVDDLKKLTALLPATNKPTHKHELISLIREHLYGDKLREMWERLDEVQQKAISEAAHSADGIFNAAKFKAKYNASPNFGKQEDRWGYRQTPSLLSLFLYGQNRYGNHATILPHDLKQQLLSFVPPPAAATLKVLDELPEFIELSEKEYELADDDEGLTLITPGAVYTMPRKPPKVTTTVHQIPLTRRETERAAQQDLLTVLRLIDKGKVAVSDKTFQASSASVGEISELLREGDFYQAQPKKNKWEQEVGPIKAFAWPLLVQAGKLAELHGKKLALTKAGRNALSAPPPETLRSIWQRWLKTKLLDEFNRIDEIKGQHGKGKRSMTTAESRRAAIDEALKQCPVGSWIEFDEFSRFMRAAGYEFEVTREPWDLYISDQQYGSLGYAGFHDWRIVQARYALCLLFEYAATLGLIDVAYIDPRGARADYGNLWGVDDLAFLSRYDGLLYFRLNPLGAYCLSLTDKYTPSQIEAKAALTVMPSLQVNVSGGKLGPEEELLFETWAEKESETAWRIDREKTLSALESGHQIAELREFLQARDEQPLPETVEGFITKSERQARALKNTGTALLIECKDAEIAELIAGHERTKKLCLRAGEKHLVIKADAEEQFRKAVHVLGYGMPRV